jgi:hypothetical protein
MRRLAILLALVFASCAPYYAGGTKCKKGCACGNACIECSKVCRK